MYVHFIYYMYTDLQCEDMSDVLSLIISNPHWQIK